MGDIVKWMRSINDGSALTDSLREVRELKAEVERLKGVLGPIIKEYDEACLDNFITYPLAEAVEAARKALEAKP